ncbi:MAG: 16S rRNA (guanine(966)-N(2))-methyltransferase RsmD [Oscillospiraceae bacterium]|nr:16S rRNA (guanine(966)-N(2))-methyltransferase RsmD [Oscillospiraceae bacterium]
MRVITGTAKGKRLRTLEGNDVRPTTDRVKEAIFSILQFRLEGRTFLDLFAGSGQMGIEALSRGAEKAYFVDSSKKALAVINENIKTCGFENKAKVAGGTAQGFLKMNREKFDIAFLDPPYRQGLIEELLPLVCENMKETGIILCEHPLDEKIVEKCCGFSLDREYRYGKIKISSFCQSEI